MLSASLNKISIVYFNVVEYLFYNLMFYRYLFTMGYHIAQWLICDQFLSFSLVKNIPIGDGIDMVQ